MARQRKVKKNVHVSTLLQTEGWRGEERRGQEWRHREWLECLPHCCFGQSIKTIPPLDKCEGGGQRKWIGGVQKGLTDPEGREK